MHRTTFNEPRPANADEMLEALEERDVDASDVNATVTDSRESEPEDSVFHGWTAEVFENDSGDEVFSTLGFPTQDELVAALRAAGIDDISDVNGEML